MADMLYEHRLRVRYAETDAMGVAHHAAYLPWLEEARIRALDALGCSYRELEANGVMMPVIEVAMSYLRPLRFDDEVCIVTGMGAIGPSRVFFTSTIMGPSGEHAKGRVVVATVGRDGRPMRFPVGLKVALERRTGG